MVSLREKLLNIGVSRDTPVSFMGKLPVQPGECHPGNFASRPRSMRAAIRSMDAPQNWQKVNEVFRDELWTDEVQGVACDGSFWIFSANADSDSETTKPNSMPKGIYSFPLTSELYDFQEYFHVPYVTVPHLIGGLKQHQSHYGQLCYYDGFVYVSHYYHTGSEANQGKVLVFKDSAGLLEYDRWIVLSPAQPPDWGGGANVYPEFQAMISGWDGCLYAGHGGPNTGAFYAFDMDGKWQEGKTLRFSGGKGKGIIMDFSNPGAPVMAIVDLPSNVQGACFSPNGHVYVACDVQLFSNTRYKAIAYFSALNGYLMGIIPVLAEGGGLELEGLCYADTSLGQIHVVLLENPDCLGLGQVAVDNIFFKSFAADRPELV
jgi:hypothetical protein